MMRFSRGLFRLWLVATVAWVVVIGVAFWQSCTFSQEHVTMCWTGESDWFGPITAFSLVQYLRLAAIALIVPALMLFLGATGLWILSGFRRVN